MAIVKNFWLKNSTKKLGGAVIYKAMGQTRSRMLADEVRNPRTTSQMNHRVKWANLVNFYRANSRWMKYAFETKRPNQTDYNKFMSLNVNSSNIYLTKDIAAGGGCVVNNYLMTQGSLPSIETTYDTGKQGWVSNIFLGPNVQFIAPIVSQFSRMLLENNAAINEGDQLSFIRLTQMTNQDTGVPYVIVREYEVVISLSNNNPLEDYLPLDYLDSDEGEQMASLMVKNSGNAGGFILILSRTIGGRTYVSTQRIVVANNDALIAAFSSSAALQAAIASYGESSEPFLTSVAAGQFGQDYVPLSIVSGYMDADPFVPGTFVQLTKDLANSPLFITFSAVPATPPEAVKVNYITGGHESTISLGNVSTEGNTTQGDFPAAAMLPVDAAVSSIIAEFHDYSVTAGFVIPNRYTIEGLE